MIEFLVAHAALHLDAGREHREQHVGALGGQRALRADRTHAATTRTPRGRQSGGVRRGAGVVTHEVVLNELVQGVAPLAEGVAWFKGLPEGGQREVLRTLVLSPGGGALQVALSSLVDTRRRKLCCAGSCTHEWHNLPDP
ncbi:DUF5958 family protein [Streptomyces murinus]